MKECGLKVIVLGLMCSLRPVIGNANEFVIDADSDPIILNFAIALLILSIIYLVCVIAVVVFVYKSIKDTEGMDRYQVSYRESQWNANRTNPFDGHAMYSRRTATLYLPGRENYGNNPSNVFTLQSKEKEENSLVYQEFQVIRDSPPVEKGQRDSMESEKTTRRRAQDSVPSFENETYAATNSGFYELSIAKTYEER